METKITVDKFVSNGIPSHDRIRVVFVHLDPIEFENCFRSWISDFISDLGGELISIDGKTSSSFKEDEKQAHGRSEQREYTLLPVPGFFNEKYLWENFNSIGKVTSNRLLNGKLSTETRYYITSLKDNEINKFAKGVRSHWGIENSLHWQLDISFSDDQSRKRAGNAAQNFGILQKITLNLLKNDKSKKAGIARKRKLAGWDTEYLERVLKSL